MKIHPSEENATSPLVAQLGDMLATALARALRHPEVIAAVRANLAPVVVTKTANLTLAEVAAELGASKATVGRLGLTPSSFVGMSARFDIESVRAELKARGRVPTKAKPKKNDVDVDATIARAGLRVAR